MFIFLNELSLKNFRLILFSIGIAIDFCLILLIAVLIYIELSPCKSVDANKEGDSEPEQETTVTEENSVPKRPHLWTTSTMPTHTATTTFASSTSTTPTINEWWSSSLPSPPTTTSTNTASPTKSKEAQKRSDETQEKTSENTEKTTSTNEITAGMGSTEGRAETTEESTKRDPVEPLKPEENSESENGSKQKSVDVEIANMEGSDYVTDYMKAQN